MRQETRTIYYFRELPTQEAKDKAIKWFLDGRREWDDYTVEELKSFVKSLGLSLVDYSFDNYNKRGSYIKTSATHEFFRDYTLIDAKALASDRYCYYCEVFRDKFIDKGSAWLAFQETLDQIKDDALAAMDYECTAEYAVDAIEANDYEFTESGEKI